MNISELIPGTKFNLQTQDGIKTRVAICHCPWWPNANNADMQSGRTFCTSSEYKISPYIPSVGREDRTSPNENMKRAAFDIHPYLELIEQCSKLERFTYCVIGGHDDYQRIYAAIRTLKSRLFIPHFIHVKLINGETRIYG